MKVQKLYEFNRFDKGIIKSVSDYFTIAIEYEIVSYKPQKRKRFSKTQIPIVIEKLREQTLLDLERGKTNEGFQEKMPLKWFEDHNLLDYLNDILDKFSAFAAENINFNDTITVNYISEFKKDRLEEIISSRYIYNLYNFAFEQSYIHLLDKVKEFLPNFHKKWGHTFKYEIEGNGNFEFSPKTYIKSLNTAFEQLEDFYSDFEKQHYWLFNHRTALHVNIGIDNPDVKWNPFKGLVMMQDFKRDDNIPYVFKDIEHRLNNRFCGSLLDAILRNVSGNIMSDYKKRDADYVANLSLRKWDEIEKEPDILKSNLDKLSLHKIDEMEDFFNEFLIKANNDFYVKEFGVKLIELNKYVEFRFVGGGRKGKEVIGIKKDIIMDKTMYFCYIVYLMTSNYKDKEYHKKAYKYLENIKDQLKKEN